MENGKPWSVGDSPCWPARWRMLWNGKAISNATSDFFRNKEDAEAEADRRNARVREGAGYVFIGGGG
jgi:hypothetical protein